MTDSEYIQLQQLHDQFSSKGVKFLVFFFIKSFLTKYNYKDRQYKVRPLDGLRNAPAPFSVSGVRGVVANQSSLLVVSPPNDRLTLRVLVTT